MSLTRADVESLIVARVGGMMTDSGMDGSATGSNPALNGPIGRAIRALGYTVASAVLVADADVGQITDAQHDEFMDHVTLHTLEAIIGHVGQYSDVSSVEHMIKRLTEQMKAAYGYGMSVPKAGYITRQR